MMLGDFNANLRDLAIAQQMLASGWTDVGQLYDTTPTCFATEQSQGTRRDFALANAAALQCIIDFRVVMDAEIRTHRPLVITMSPASGRLIAYTRHIRPKPFSPLFKEIASAKIREKREAADIGESEDSSSPDTDSEQSCVSQEETERSDDEDTEEKEQEIRKMAKDEPLTPRSRKRKVNQIKHQVWKDMQRDAAGK